MPDTESAKRPTACALGEFDALRTEIDRTTQALDCAPRAPGPGGSL